MIVTVLVLHKIVNLRGMRKSNHYLMLEDIISEPEKTCAVLISLNVKKVNRTIKYSEGN